MAPLSTLEYFRVKPRWLFVKITDTEGHVGWGEATLEGHTLAVEGCLDAFRARLLHRKKGPQTTAERKIWDSEGSDSSGRTKEEGTGAMDCDCIEEIWQCLYRQGFYRGGPVLMSALSGVDIALWDLKARNLGVPIYELLGGKIREMVGVYAWIGGDRPDDVGGAAQERRKQGFRAVKMNATGDVGWLESPERMVQGTVERVKSVKAAGMDVGVDFHGRIHRPMAKQLAKALEAERPLFIEEPVLSEHPEAVEGLSRLTTVPIALGERLYSRWDVKPFLERGAVDILQPDVSHCGGISELRRIAAMAEAYDVAIAPHCPLGPIALAACVQVDLATPNFAIQEMSLGIHYNVQAGEYDITSYIRDRSVWDVKEGGYILAPEGNGLGIEIDEEEVRKVSASTNPWESEVFFGANGEIREW